MGNLQSANRSGVEGAKSRFRGRSYLPRVSLCSAVVCLSLGVGLYCGWRFDKTVLRHKAIEITASSRLDSSRIVAINNWVSSINGVAKNDGYFVFAALGPTPLQILQKGGDCADKSRLAAAMLNELGIEAGLVMIRSCSDCPFGHTVVEARYERGRMVIDPLWGVDYPAGDGRYLGVGELAWTNLAERRLVDLQSRHGPIGKIATMPARDAIFDHAVAINWNKNFATITMVELMRLTGYPPEKMFRPRFLEDPKLALIYLLVIMGLVLAAPSVVALRSPDGKSTGTLE